MLSGSPVSAPLSPPQLLERFLSAAPPQRNRLWPQLEAQAQTLVPLLPECLGSLPRESEDWAPGCLIQLLLRHGDSQQRAAFLALHPDGWLSTPSQRGISFAPLQRLLMACEFEAADRETSALLRQLAGPAAEARGYVYFSEVPAMPGADLESLDRLWWFFSRGRFGFSVQGRLLRVCGGRWELLWPRLGWKRDGVWTRYPGAFTWTLEAPEGHMPLVNQLRGVRLMDALLQHPALQRRINA